jgi:signal transduction histidine kinase
MSGRSRDVLAAAVLAVGLTGGTLLLIALVQSRHPAPHAPTTHEIVLVSLLNLAGCAPIAIRRAYPAAALAAATALVLGAVAAAVSAIAPGLALVVCAYTVATRWDVRRVAPLLTVAAFAHAGGGILLSRHGGDVRGLPTFWGVPGQDLDAMITATAASYALPGLAGALVRRRRAHTAALTARAETLEAERAERDAAATAEERGRIARELHDIAAHDLSAIVVQAGAADRLVSGDPDAARAVLRSIRGQGRDTLTALRALVGILRDDESGGRAPPPGLDRVGDLFAVARAAGMPLTTLITATGRLTRPADLAAYRVVQEALANARRHAPGAPVTVSIGGDPGVRLEIRNPLGATTAAGDGHGLAGMRERIRQAGGTIRAGPDGADWAVVVTLPAAS